MKRVAEEGGKTVKNQFVPGTIKLLPFDGTGVKLLPSPYVVPAIDPDKLSGGPDVYFKHNVTFWTYNPATITHHGGLRRSLDGSDDTVAFKQNACFSGILRAIADMQERNHTHICVGLCRRFYETVPEITVEEATEWALLCKKHWLLPEEVDERYLAKTFNFVFTPEGKTSEAIYVYLCAARYLQEMPTFVRSMLYITRELQIDFFLAFILASRCSSVNVIHHIVPLAKDYKKAAAVAKRKYDYAFAYALRKFVQHTMHNDTPISFGDKNLRDVVLAARWNIHTKLFLLAESAPQRRSILSSLSVNQLRLPSVVNAVYAD